MTHGLLYWDDRRRYYSQVNNSIERLLKTKNDGKGWLETCGPTSTVMLLDMQGRDVTCGCPGKYNPQPEDVLTLWMNDPRNEIKMAAARRDIKPFDYPGNQIAQYYPPAVKDVFGVEANYIEGGTWEVVKLNVIQGHGVMVAMRNPGHFIAIVAYDNTKDAMIYHDPWPKNSDGWSKYIRHQDWAGFIKPYCIAYL